MAQIIRLRLSLADGPCKAHAKVYQASDFQLTGGGDLIPERLNQSQEFKARQSTPRERLIATPYNRCGKRLSAEPLSRAGGDRGFAVGESLRLLEPPLISVK